MSASQVCCVWLRANGSANGCDPDIHYFMTTAKNKLKTPITSPSTPLDPIKLPRIEIKSLDQIVALHREPIVVSVVAYDKELILRGRRLNPAEQHRVREILDSVLPPRKGEEFDFSDPEYRRNMALQHRRARGLTVALAFPELFPGVESQDLDVLYQQVEAQAQSDEILEVLYSAAARNPVEKAALVGFTSGSSSLKS